MRNMFDKVHAIGMSDDSSTYMSVEYVESEDGAALSVEPPIEVILEGKNARVAIVQGPLAARYTNEELGKIGDDNPFLGLKRVIGAAAVSGGLTEGAIKPLHPSLLEATAVEAPAKLTPPPRQLSA